MIYNSVGERKLNKIWREVTLAIVLESCPDRNTILDWLCQVFTYTYTHV